VKSNVRLHRAFVKDVKAQVAWLEGEGRGDQTDGLEVALEEAVSLLASQNGVGALEASEGGLELRRLLLRRLPFVIWFQAGPGREVWLLRLFHVRQARPHPRLNERRRPPR
jgi:plasmid stabilization system protein ParE